MAYIETGITLTQVQDKELSFICASTSSRYWAGIGLDGTLTGFPVVGMWCSPTSVRPGQFLNSSQYFSTIGINTGSEQLGSITVPSSMKLRILHSSPMSTSSESASCESKLIVANTKGFLCRFETLVVLLGKLIPTGSAEKSRTTSCCCMKSTPKITGDARFWTTKNSCCTG